MKKISYFIISYLLCLHFILFCQACVIVFFVNNTVLLEEVRKFLGEVLKIIPGEVRTSPHLPLKPALNI